MTWDRIFAAALMVGSVLAGRQSAMDCAAMAMSIFRVDLSPSFEHQMQALRLQAEKQTPAQRVVMLRMMAFSIWFWRLVAVALGVGAGLLLARPA